MAAKVDVLTVDNAFLKQQCELQQQQQQQNSVLSYPALHSNNGSSHYDDNNHDNSNVVNRPFSSETEEVEEKQQQQQQQCVPVHMSMSPQEEAVRRGLLRVRDTLRYIVCYTLHTI